MKVGETLKEWFTEKNKDEDFLTDYTWVIFGLGMLFTANLAYIAPQNGIAFFCWGVSIIIALMYSFAVANKFVVVRK